jgi:peptidoglycan/LPS O-acetylase OafA/YrhL
LQKSTISAEGWVPSLNGLRAVSVSLVIGSHLFYAHPELAQSTYLTLLFNGALGVRIFFVISGFLITMLLLREMDNYGFVSLSNFYVRRIIRLFPVQFIYILFLFFMTLVTPLRIDACRYVTAITFTKNYACGGWIDGHLWSLSVEEQFYLIWPIALISMRTKNAWVFAIFLIGFAPISRAIEYMLGSRLYAWLPSNADGLMIGCLLALYAQRHSGKLEKIAAWHPTTTRVMSVLLMYIPILLSSRKLFGVFTVTLGPTLQTACAAVLIRFLAVRSG